VLITGAGASMESPTDLRSGGEYSEIAHRRLVDDGVLVIGECAAPWDLSDLASVVYAKAQSQVELTRRLPREAWRTARPNDGHFAAAALLIEGAVRAIVTLNYDLAQQTALTMLGCPPAVAVIRGPEEHDRLGAGGLIYIHRSVESDEETWVLRREVLDDAWRDGWEEMIASGALSSPIVIFAGLGSAAAVLTETVERLSRTGAAAYYLADPFPESKFAEALADRLAGVWRLSWVDLTEKLAARVCAERIASLGVATADLAREQGWNANGPAIVLEALGRLSLVQLGVLRGAWFASTASYTLHRPGSEERCMADLVIALGYVATSVASQLDLQEGGLIRLTRPDGTSVAFLAAHGHGVDRWSSLQVRVESRHRASLGLSGPRTVLVCGTRPDVTATPQDVIRTVDDQDVIRGSQQLVPIFAEDVRPTTSGSADDLWRRLAS